MPLALIDWTEPLSALERQDRQHERDMTMAKKNEGNGRQHKATYARDKRNGGYLVRVAGPNANRFAGREVPVTRRDDSEDVEKLDSLIWTGKDTDTGENVALYSFVAKPREELEDNIPF